jgi:hypothetical protein
VARRKDPRPFIAVHDDIHNHPKVVGLSDAAFRLLHKLWCETHRFGLDGVVTEAQAKARGPKVFRELTAPAYPGAAPLLEPLEDGTWYCHDYTSHQWTAAELEDMAAKNRANGARGGRPRKPTGLPDQNPLGSPNGTQT